MRSARLALVLVAVACRGAEAPNRTRPPVGAGVTHVEVRAGSDGRLLTVVDDPARIAAAVSFVDARRGGWETPWAGKAPGGPFVATFYRGAARVANFSPCGGGCFVVYGPGFRGSDGGFHRASEAELAAFRAVLGLADSTWAQGDSPRVGA